MANRRTPAAVASEAMREIIDQKLAELRRMPPGDIVGVEIKMTVLQAIEHFEACRRRSRPRELFQRQLH